MPKLIRILSIDGGGIRGLIAAQVLAAIERKLRQRSGNPDARLIDYFDMLAGTSTGGILCLLLATPGNDGRQSRYSAADAIEIYLEHGPQIFELPLYHRLSSAGGLSDEKYPSDGIETVLAGYFGDTWMSQLLLPVMVPAYDIRRRRAMFFTQHDALKGPSRDFHVRDVARATSAAPTYFETANVVSRTGIHYPCIDGGVFANNPSLCAYAEARTHFGARAAEMAILSVGTGDVAQPYFFDEAKDWGALSWMKPLISIMMSGVAETVDYECRLAFDAVGTPEQYLRLNAKLRDLPPGVSSNLDDATERNLVGLCEVGLELAQNQNAELDAFVDLLLAEDEQATVHVAT